MIVNAASRGLLGARFSLLRNRIVTYAKSAKEEQKVFWEKNQKLNRPMSPHLTIYKLPLTAKMSISHRVTGAALSGIIYLGGLAALVFNEKGSFQKLSDFLQYNIHPHVLLTLKTLLAFPLIYHTLAGCRHLYWDTGRGLKLPALYKSGYTLIAIALLSSFALATL